MAAPLKVKLTSQFQSYTKIINWVEIYEHMLSSGLSYKRFYKNKFPELVERLMPEGYIPSYTTFASHILKIKREGKQQYIEKSRGGANHQEWENIYDEYISSGMSKIQFYKERIQQRFLECSLKTFYSRIKRIERKQQETFEDIQSNTVSVVTLDASSFSNMVPSVPSAQSAEVFTRPAAQTQISIKVGANSSINFESANPEYSIAKIITALERLK